jgi:hypothetical protein
MLGICFFAYRGEYTGEPVWEGEKGVDEGTPSFHRGITAFSSSYRVCLPFYYRVFAASVYRSELKAVIHRQGLAEGSRIRQQRRNIKNRCGVAQLALVFYGRLIPITPHLNLI